MPVIIDEWEQSPDVSKHISKHKNKQRNNCVAYYGWVAVFHGCCNIAGVVCAKC